MPWKYVAALAGSDIQTNPPETNSAVAASGQQFVSRIQEMLSSDLQAELDAAIDVADLERVLMEQGIAKFVAPQKQLLETIRQKRQALVNDRYFLVHGLGFDRGRDCSVDGCPCWTAKCHPTLRSTMEP